MGRFTLILIVAFAVVAGGMRLNHGRLARDAQDTSNAKFVETTVRNITNSAVYMTLRQIAQNFNWRTGYSNLALLNGTVDVNLEDSSTDTTLDLNQVRITADASFSAETSTAVVLVSKSAFSEFAYFTDVEPLIWFITGDTLMGPIHTNGQFHIWGNPVFYGRVSSVASSWYGTGNPEFKAGTAFGIPEIQLPIDLSILEGKAQDGGSFFEGDVSIEFLADGTFNWSVYHMQGTTMVIDSSGNVVIDETNGVIATQDGYDLRVKGTLDGQATMLSGDDVWIDDDVLYNQNPLTDPTADDMLGIISKKNIYFTDNVPNRSNLTINATLMALDSKITAQNYNTGTPRGELFILGGLVQKERGAVGTFSGGVIQTGYRKKYVYDQRFLTQAPPFYPVFSKNTIVSWYE
ncbi:MAG: DUF4900 domain-containing protein [bacterium]